MNKPRLCARCQRPFAAPEVRGQATAAYCSFRCEAQALLAGCGPGLRWLVVTVGWGLATFSLVVLIVRLFLQGLPDRPLPYLALIAVLVLVVALLTPWFRRSQ
jgi:hypothetical protein